MFAGEAYTQTAYTEIPWYMLWLLMGAQVT
jgi:hypothetical protein